MMQKKHKNYKKKKIKLDANTKALILALSLVMLFWTLYFIECGTLKNKVIECILMCCVWSTVVFSNKFKKLFK